MSRSLWSDRPLGVKLSALVGAALLVLLVFALPAGALLAVGVGARRVARGVRSPGSGPEAA